jgi:ubiquitin-conjugating enzyme E2 S
VLIIIAMAPNLRRLASDHADLHNSQLPPNYLFPVGNAFSSVADDLTQLTVLLTGPQGTPYSHGLWRVQLKIPEDYPKSPPRAFFKTRIWHPNVEELSGAVCVDTLKRDWEPKLSLRDVLITISCLLIHPNPDSALNSAAGALLQDDYEAFAHHAKLMASIHAPIPKDIRDAVMEAKRRGEDPQTMVIFEGNGLTSLAKQSVTNDIRVIMKKRSGQHQEESFSTGGSLGEQPVQMSGSELESRDIASGDDTSDAEYDDPAIASKENDPSLSPSPVALVPPSPRKSLLGKRPLSVLSTAFDPDTVMLDADGRVFDGMTASEKNIAANNDDVARPGSYLTPRKSPKLSHRHKSVTAPNGTPLDDVGNGDNSSSSNGSRQSRPLLESIPSFQDGESQLQIYEDSHEPLGLRRPPSGDGKENFESQTGLIKGTGIILMKKPTATTLSKAPTISQPTSKISKSVAGIRKAPSTAVKSKPRIGVRRL